MVEVGHGYLATRWRPDLPPGGATRVLKVLFLSCLWANLVDTWVDGRDRSWLPCHQVAPRSATRGRHYSMKGSFSAVCGLIWLILGWVVGVGNSYLAIRWRPNWPPGGTAGG